MDTIINNQRILLTGSTGYVGQYLLPELLKRGFPVNVLIRPGNKLTPNAKVKVFYGDLTNQTNIKKATERVETVVHSAARLSVFEDGLVKKTNIDGLKKLLSEIDGSLSIKRFIFISTIDVKIRKNDYTDSKIKGEIIVREYCKKNNINCIIVRLGNVYNGSEGGIMKGVIDILRKNNWKSAVLFHLLGVKTLRLIKIDDLVIQLMSVIEKRKIKNQTIEIAGERRTISQITNYLKEEKIIPNLPKFTIIAPIFFPIWKIIGKIMKRADLLIYLDTEI